MTGCSSNRHRLFDMLSIGVTLTIVAALVLTGCRRRSRTGAGEGTGPAVEAARSTAPVKRTEATLDMLAAACDAYWAQYRTLPYPQADHVGVGKEVLGQTGAFREVYYDGGWTDEAYNVAFCWIMSRKQTSRAFIDMQEACFQPVGKGLTGPDGRRLHRVVDGFDRALRVERPEQYYVQRVYVKFISAGADGDFETEDDNIERTIKR